MQRDTSPAAMTPREPRLHLVNLVAFTASWVFATVFVAAVAIQSPWPSDAWVYWSAWHGPMYARASTGSGFVYPPVAALLFLPAVVLPWPLFAIVWISLLFVAGAWLMWPLPMRLRLPLFASLAASLAWGNAATLLAVPLVLAPRWPVLWVAQAWVKVTPAVGVVALLAQHRWRQFATVVGAIGLVGIGLVLLAPAALGAWLNHLAAHSEVPGYWLAMLPWSPPLALRLVVAAAIAYLGAARPWTLAIAAAVATPDLSLATCGILAAIPRLAEQARPDAHCESQEAAVSAG